jgi:D-alanyl-D-alanine carboxypeptidase/D-alanyl-D-alanine-endopeptidase (penicillin-binding protein 4)
MEKMNEKTGKKNKKVIFGIILLLCFLALFFPSVIPSEKVHYSSLGYFESNNSANYFEQELRRFKNDPALKNASWGLSIINLQNGKSIASHNQNLALVPASTQKILTTVTALLFLGNEFKFQTTLGYSGFIDQGGTLHGDLVVTGSGDPSFASTQLHDSLRMERVFGKWLLAIKEAGIKQVNGRVFVNESVFDHEMIPRKWLWEDMGNYYGAGASGLTVNENMYTVFFQPGNEVGQAARVLRTEPMIPAMEYINQVKTGPRGSGDQVYIFGAPYQIQRTLTGTVPLGRNDFPVRGSIPDPPLFFAMAFSGFLTQNGIQISGTPISYRIATASGLTAPKAEKVLSIYTSPSLTHIANRTNLSSVNTYAENLLKTVGNQAKGTGSFSAGIEATIEFWKNRGLDVDGMFLYDGSGLTPSNRLTAAQLTGILQAMSLNPRFEDFKAGLPLAGRTGWLANQLRGTPSEGVLYAKSGFIANVRSYAGYSKTSDGKEIAFAFIVNDYQGTPASMREKMTKLMDAITRYNQ